MRPFLVMSGLPGSGKTTLGRSLARALDLPLLDKDEILEGLFDSLGIGDAEWRSRLSRAADEVLCRLARESGGAVCPHPLRALKSENDEMLWRCSRSCRHGIERSKATNHPPLLDCECEEHVDVEERSHHPMSSSRSLSISSLETASPRGGSGSKP